MLSKFFLLFTDKDMRKSYEAEKINFYKKSIPILTILLLILSMTLEILFRGYDLEHITVATSLINWIFLVILVVFSVLIWRNIYWVSWFICPMLTIIIFYYFAF